MSANSTKGSGVSVKRVKSVGLLFAVAVTLSAVLAASASGAYEPEKYALESASASLSTTQAGAHADFTTSFAIKIDPNSGGNKEPYATTRDIKIALPPGLLGNLNNVDQCSPTDFNAAFEGGGCPFSSQVGVSRVVVSGVPLEAPLNEAVYLMQIPRGSDIVARMGFYGFTTPLFINIRARSDSDYGLTAFLEGLPSLAKLNSATTTIWGVPGASSHDTRRITPRESFELKTGSPPREFGRPEAPFLTNPTRCPETEAEEEAGQVVSIGADSYPNPGVFSTINARMEPIKGCEALAFEPSFEATPTSHAAGAPTGLDATLKVPQNEAPLALATSQLRSAHVTFPPGMTIAPGAASGLEACTPQQAGFHELHAAECPLASKLGSATFTVPALTEPLEGAVYQRSSEPGHLVRIWLIADEQGLHLALSGEIELNPANGQITSAFIDNPQAPLSELKLHLKQGPRAPLSNPNACGTYQTHYDFTPWAGTPDAEGDTPMSIDEACSGKGAFNPTLSAGTSSLTAGAYAALSFDIARPDGDQNISALNLTLPPGLLAKLAGVGVCPEADALSANCPASSQVGTTTLAVGPGTAPLTVPQPGKEPTAIYLAGPYKSAPYSFIVKVPAQAGPFDLGTVAVRSALYIDPESAQPTVKSDPLPQYLQGIPVSYRQIRVDVNRPEFTLNPTSCEAKAITSQISGAAGAVASPSSRFQVGECGALGFKPKLAIKLKGGTKRSQFPALTATLTERKGDANIAKAVVTLPHSEFLEQAHIGTICTKVQFAANACPKRSIYGKAKAISPLLEKPLEGPVYLRSSDHPLPDLVADLNGQINVVLDGRIDSVNGGIRASFEAVPDAPVSKFTLEMQGGSKGLLVNSRDICKSASKALAVFGAQNGRGAQLQPVLANGCSKGKGRKGKKGK